jgi:hypothetical protein
MSHLRHNDLDLFTRSKVWQEEARIFFDFKTDILLSPYGKVDPYCSFTKLEDMPRARFMAVPLEEFLINIDGTKVKAESLTELIFWTLTQVEEHKSLVKLHKYREEDREFGKGGPTLRLRAEPPILETWVRTGLEGLQSLAESHIPPLTLPDIEFVNIGGDAFVGGYCLRGIGQATAA